MIQPECINKCGNRTDTGGKCRFCNFPKTKFKTNKEILELPGCPPDILNCLTMLIKFYGKSNMPNLSLFKEVLETWFNPNDKKYLKAMGVL